jgi:predicted Zn-dependent peptidase
MMHIVVWIRKNVLRSPAIFGLILFGSVAPRNGWSQTPDSPAPPAGEAKANPFSGFETHFLSNGLKVWFKQLPDAPEVSVSVGVPYGWDADPVGKEELAHPTEHILFSDHDGQTEQEIKEAIDGLGGRRNGFRTGTATP